MECALCGSRRANRKAMVEGAIVNVCDSCVGFGKEVAKVEFKKIKREIKMPREMEEMAVQDFSRIIRREREKRKCQAKKNKERDKGKI